MAEQVSNAGASWESTQRTYEGFPLYLRRPKDLDFDVLSARFPIHLTVTHEFSFRSFDGAPEPTYNRGLEELDIAVTGYCVLRLERARLTKVGLFGSAQLFDFYVSPSVGSNDCCVRSWANGSSGNYGACCHEASRQHNHQKVCGGRILSGAP